MTHLVKKYIFALAAVLCGVFAMSCNDELAEIKDYADNDNLLKVFAVSYGTSQYYANINYDDYTMSLSDIVYGELITSVKYVLEDGATISPIPGEATWAESQTYTVTLDGKSEKYTFSLPDYADLVDFKSVGYITSAYWQYDSVIETIDWSNLSHVILSFLQVNTDGSYTETANLTSKMSDLKSKAANNDFKLMIAVQSSSTNGNTSGDFYTAINSESTRATLIENLVTYMRDRELDGIDIDFEEYSRVGSTAYATFLKELKAAIEEAEEADDRDYLYSIAVAPNISGYPTDLGSTVDFINLMLYDFSQSYTNAQHASYSSFTSYMNSSEAKFGATKRQLIGGLPFYGYTYDGLGTVTTTSSGTQKAYSEIFPAYVNKTSGDVTYTPLYIADNDQVANTVYNGRVTLANKCQYVVDNSFGGVMIWHIGQDIFDTSYEDYKLLTVIGETIEFIEGKGL